jgi:hypothetical protein
VSETFVTVGFVAPSDSFLSRANVRRDGRRVKLADAYLEFHVAPLAGIRLIGFQVWQHDGRPDDLSVTMPAYFYEKDKRSIPFFYLHPDEPAHLDALEDYILDAFEVGREKGETP